MPKQPAVLDPVFKALADPTRRAVVERLTAGPAATTALAEGFDLALPTFTQHLGVLERGGLVTSHKDGRIRTYHLVPAPIDRAAAWMLTQRTHWERRLDQLDHHLSRLKEQS